jgi:hypothetical protein
MERQFKGVWIPAELWLDENLSKMEMLLLAEIDSFSRNGDCFASNEHFAKFLRVSKKRVSEMLTSLNRKGYISIDLIYKLGTKEIEKRLIKPILLFKHTPIAEKEHTPTEKGVDPMPEKEHTPIAEKEQENNTFITNTINKPIKDIKKINKKEKSAELEREFETLWKLYPRKEGKTAAKKHYIKARKNKTLYETVENGLYRYKDYLEQQGTESQYIPHGSSWFCQERWNDEYIITGLNRKPKNALEYLRMKQEGESYEPSRGRKVVDDYTTLVSEPF